MRSWVLALVIGVVVLSSSRPARADLAGAVYDDLHDVVEQLIQTEVTTSVVTAIEKRSPALAFYLRGTLERLASPYWGSLGHALKDDLTIAVSDFVYWHLSTGGGDGDVVGSAKRFFACVQGKAAPGCDRLAQAVQVQKRPLLEVECRRAKPPPERRVACDIGLAVLAGLEQRGEVRHHVVDALADIVLSEIDDHAMTDRLRDVLIHWMDLPKDLPTPLLEALANPDLAAQLADGEVEKLCGDPKTIDDALRDPGNGRAWICFAVTHPKLPDQLAATVAIVDGTNKVEARVDFWRIEAALKDVDPDRINDDSAVRLVADVALDDRCPPGDTTITAWPCKGQRLGPGSTVSIKWLGHEVTAGADKTGLFVAKPGKQMTSSLLRFRKLIRRIEDLRSLVPPSLGAYVFYAGSTPPSSKQVLRSIARMARLVTELRARWYLWNEDKSKDKKGSGFQDLDVAELLHVARDAMEGTDIPGLAFLDKTAAAGGASNIDIGDWLRMVMRGDYRSLAMESLRAALDLPLTNDGSRPRETFFLTLAAYLLDSGDGNTGESVARSAFRAAAKDLLLSQSHMGVPRVGDRVRFRLLPRLSLKLSFNDTYAVTDGDSKRNVVSADWPTFMVAFTDYAGIELSLIDPAAPLAEMALRPAGTYHDYPYVALDALRPRLGAWVAVPQLSRRLALTTGFGARFLDVKRNPSPVDMPMAIDATYGFKASLTFDAGVQFVF